MIYRFKELAKAAIAFFFSLLDSIFLLPVQKGESDHIALVRVDEIGDFVLWLDSAQHFRSRFPGRKIVLVCNSAVADLAGLLPWWDDVFPVDTTKIAKSMAYRRRILAEIRRTGFALAIQPTFSRNMMIGDAIIRATGAPQRIGSSGDLSNIFSWQKACSDRWYTALVPAVPEQLTEIERNAEFVDKLFSVRIPNAICRLSKCCDLDGMLLIDEPYFIVFPGSTRSRKCWPPDNYVELVDQVASSTGYLPVLCGSLAERELCSSISRHCTSRTLNVAGHTSIPQFIEFVRRAKFLVGNDTAAIHIAAAVDTPSVCILGGGHFGRFMPYPDNISGTKPIVVVSPMPCFGCNWICTQVHKIGGPTPCISNITPGQVLAATGSLLPQR